MSVLLDELNRVDAEFAERMLSAVVNPNVDWAAKLRQEVALRVFYGTAVVLAAGHVCNRCGADMAVMAIRGNKICVDADYFIEMADGKTVFEFSDVDRIVKAPSSISLPSYAVAIHDIQEGFLDRLMAGIRHNQMEAFRALRFEKAGAVYRNLCPECDAAQDEADFLAAGGGRFHPACPESERSTLYPENDTPLILRCGLLPLADI